MRAPSTERGVEGSAKPSRPLPGTGRPTAAIIDLDALKHNYQEVVRCAEGRSILAVVKAQAYGHGALPIARHLVDLGVDMLGVALVEEGRELRDSGIRTPILVMSALFPEQAEAVAAAQLTPVVYSMTMARALSRAAKKQGKTVALHVKIDTGMGRVGIAPEAALGFIEDVQSLDNIVVQGLMTHFADADLRNKEYASRQMDFFSGITAALDARHMAVPLRHAANSAAVLDYHRALFTMVRPGLMLYGYNPLEGGAPRADLVPVMTLATCIAFMKKVPAGTFISYGRTFETKRDSLIATIPIGYADGYSRGLSNKGIVLVRGKRAPVVGRVCMDMCMIDVTDVPGVAEGEEVVLMGAQGNDRISADDIALQTGTIAYEVLCGISSRVPRIY